MQEKKSSIVSTCIACCICLVLLVIFFMFVFVFGAEEPVYQVQSEARDGESADTAAGKLAFTADVYEVQANQEMDMSQYLQCEGMSPEDVVWSSDSDRLAVGSKGHIVANDYGMNCNLVASSKTDDTVKAACVIRSGTEAEDFAWQVGALNGEQPEDEAAEDGTVRLAYSKEDSRIIDVKGTEREPGERNAGDTWNGEIFYKLEDVDPDSERDGQINSYRVEKKKFIDQETGNEIEYEIYHHPDTDIIHKIVSIEYMPEKLGIVEYYYTDKGEVNFVYAYRDVNYTPSYATPDRNGERYLCYKDTLVTWRIVKDGKMTNYCSGSGEQKRLTERGFPNVILYSDCSKEIKKKYDKKEKEILNMAYNVLDVAMNQEGFSAITGYINEASGEGLGDVEVSLESEEYDEPLCTVETDQEGCYEIMVPTKEAEYQLHFQKEGYIEEILYGIEADVSEVSLSQEEVRLSHKDENEYDCELTFYDALNKSSDGNGMDRLDESMVIIRRGVNNRTSEPVFQGLVSGYRGSVSLTPGMYTVQMSRDGYMDTYSSLFVSRETGNELAVYATPKLKEDEYRIVLTWNEEPRDLDSHLFAPTDTGEAEDHHICYYHMEDKEGDHSLDVDDTDGYGPETTTISQVRRGQYKFYVCDYTNCSQDDEKSTQMSDSSATVRVYGSQGLIQTFYVPAHRSGVIWEVFEIRDGAVIPSQRYYDVIENKSWWRSEK